MSTICKLSPMIRQDRAERRALLLRRFGRLENEAIRDGNHDLAAKVIGAHDLLHAVAASPYRSGLRKQRIFRRIARELAEAGGVRLG